MNVNQRDIGYKFLLLSKKATETKTTTYGHSVGRLCFQVKHACNQPAAAASTPSEKKNIPTTNNLLLMLLLLGSWVPWFGKSIA